MLMDNIFHQMLDSSNKVDNLEHLMCTIGLVALEMGAGEVSFRVCLFILPNVKHACFTFGDS